MRKESRFGLKVSTGFIVLLFLIYHTQIPKKCVQHIQHLNDGNFYIVNINCII